MATVPTRLDVNALDILKQYSPGSASEAVRLMDSKIRMLQSVTPQLQNVTEPFDWARLEALLRKHSCKSPQETKVMPFQTGTAVKQFGKIEPEDQLQEPIGRQGRKL
jgi:hypothetical protein